jgi:uncharacterized protein (TIGR02757 family)
MNSHEFKEFLDEKAVQYEQVHFLEKDPIQIPHSFEKKEDIEISGFLVATIAWGNRVSIIKNGKRMMELMDNDPYSFILNHSEKELNSLKSFVHRTFNGTDFIYFVQSLQNIYLKHGGLEKVFSKDFQAERMDNNIHHFKKIFFELPHQIRTEKHVSDPVKGSAAKRINMFLRWMVRPATKKVDFGIWNRISTKQLSCPLDIHSGSVARDLQLLKRKQNDLKALIELDTVLRSFDPVDPVKYDFALFGLGVNEDFNTKDITLKL